MVLHGVLPAPGDRLAHKHLTVQGLKQGRGMSHAISTMYPTFVGAVAFSQVIRSKATVVSGSELAAVGLDAGRRTLAAVVTDSSLAEAAAPTVLLTDKEITQPVHRDCSAQSITAAAAAWRPLFQIIIR